jgi:hypothetical protein
MVVIMYIDGEDNSRLRKMSGTATAKRTPVMHVYRFAVGEIVLLTKHRGDVSWKAEYTVVSHVRPADLEVRYLIRSTSRPSERTAREHELSASA